MKNAVEKKRRPTWTALAGALLLTLSLLAPPAYAAEDCYPPCAAGYASLVDALKSVGADAAFPSRQTIAQCNGVAHYSGTAAQNTLLLAKLKAGTLRRPGGGGTGSAPLDTNQSAVQYIPQEYKTCKATAVAMAVNLLRGNNSCTTAGMGGSLCSSIAGAVYTGSDGRRYTGVYKTDSYTGSAAELEGAVDAALAAGVPIVAAVHSTAGGTRHHWVVVVGSVGGDYMIVDPAYGRTGSVAENVFSMSERRYAFGLTDYAQPHWGYVTFAAS